MPLLLFVCLSKTGLAQRLDSFEGGEPRWRLVESDCQAQLTSHEISPLTPHNGRTCEMFEVDCTHGTLALLAYPIEPCAILNEFQPELWTRCASGRLQIGLRVVFPFATHPVSEGRLTTILWGDTYTETGSWQKLRLASIENRLTEELVAIRQRFGSETNLEGAFVDCIVFNAYTGPGRYHVQIDDLNLRGMVSLAALGQTLPPNWRQGWRWRLPTPSRADRFWASPNSPPMFIQYRGESLPWLQSLGISGVVMENLPSREQLVKAQAADISVIAPPPPYAVDYPQEALPALKGWLIGAALDRNLEGLAREQVERVASFPQSLRRPLIAEAMEGFFQYSRIADEVIIPQPISFAAGSADAKTQWLEQKLGSVQQRGQGWVSVNLGVPPAIANQLETAVELLEPGTDTADLSVEPLAFRHQTTSAIMAGARGVLVRTFRPLELHSPSDNAQNAAIRWVANDLNLWGPWIVGGQRTQAPAISSSDWKTAAWTVEQSQLIVAQYLPEGSQACLPATHQRPIELGVSSATNRQQIFRLTSGRLERIDPQTSPAGMQWQVENPQPVESFLITADTRVLNYVRKQLDSTITDSATNRLDIVNHYMRIAARTVGSQEGPNASGDDAKSATAGFALLGRIQRRIDAGIQALQTQNPAKANEHFAAAEDEVRGILHAAQQSAQANLASPQSSPLVSLPAAFNLHWKLADACSRTEWTDVNIPGSNLRSLNEMIQAGWSQNTRLENQVDLRVELIPEGLSVAGMLASLAPQATNQSGVTSPGLRMAAYAKREDVPLEGGYAGTSLRIRSAGIPVKAGDLVRISATARVLKANKDPATGLLFYDNQAGPSLGQLVRGSVGSTLPIELYRFVVEDNEFRVLAECRGECDIILDSIRCSVIRPATRRSRFFTGPVDPYLFKAQEQ